MKIRVFRAREEDPVTWRPPPTSFFLTIENVQHPPPSLKKDFGGSKGLKEMAKGKKIKYQAYDWGTPEGGKVYKAGFVETLRGVL